MDEDRPDLYELAAKAAQSSRRLRRESRQIRAESSRLMYGSQRHLLPAVPNLVVLRPPRTDTRR